MNTAAYAFQFKPATKAAAKLRAALFGPSGSGKTFSALRVASGLGGRIAVIDTERGSASKYADRFGFDVLDLADKSIPAYQAAIRAAAQAGYEVLVIDSLSHGWQELLAEVDRLASAKYKGNTWSAWSEGTPKQRALVDAILEFPRHVLATMRSKTEWTTESDRNGKSRPVRIGLAPEQGKGIEYEFDLLLEISPDHVAQVIKDRSGRFQDQLLDKPGEDFGRELAAWLSDAPEEAPTHPPKLGLVGPSAAQTAPTQFAPSGNAPQPKASPAPRSERGAATHQPAGQPPKLISEAQHRRLEALLRDAGLPRERVRNWLAARHPGAYPEGIHFDKLWVEHAKQIEEKIPDFVAKMKAEEEASERKVAEHETALAEALDWASAEYEWNGSVDQLAEIAADASKRAGAANMRAQAKEGHLEVAEVRDAERLAERAQLLQKHVQGLREGETA